MRCCVPTREVQRVKSARFMENPPASTTCALYCGLQPWTSSGLPNMAPLSLKSPKIPGVWVLRDRAGNLSFALYCAFSPEAAISLMATVHGSGLSLVHQGNQTGHIIFEMLTQQNHVGSTVVSLHSQSRLAGGEPLTVTEPIKTQHALRTTGLGLQTKSSERLNICAG